jgi:hypothetical protein
MTLTPNDALSNNLPTVIDGLRKFQSVPPCRPHCLKSTQIDDAQVTVQDRSRTEVVLTRSDDPTARIDAIRAAVSGIR